MIRLMKGNVWGQRKDAKDRKGNPIVTYPVYVEPKHDEIRCHVRVGADDEVQFLSYAGKPLANMQGFAEMFRYAVLAYHLRFREFDCGFEVNGNFNDSYRWVRSTNGIPADLQDAECTFFLFDLPECVLPYCMRQEVVYNIAQIIGIRSVPWTLANDEQEVAAIYHQYRALGLEGVMVKLWYHKYEPGKRTDGWLKWKPKGDADGVIIGLNEAISLSGVPLGRIGSVDLKMDDGSIASPSGIAHELGRDMYLNPQKYLGDTCEFTYMERDRAGGYRHPVFHRIREATK